MDKFLWVLAITMTVATGFGAQGLYYFVPSALAIWNAQPDQHPAFLVNQYIEAWILSKAVA